MQTKNHNSIRNMLELRNAGAVQRFHTYRMMHEQQTLADHSWGVAMLMLHIYPEAKAHLLHAALTHDLSELVTGDVPAPAKWENQALEDALRWSEQCFNDKHQLPKSTLTSEECNILKWCDGFELALRCWEERRLGNLWVDSMWSNILQALAQRGDPPTLIAAELFQWLQLEFLAVGANGKDHV